MACLVITPEIRKMQKEHFQGETPRIVANMISIWQNHEMQNGNKSITIESMPSVEQLQQVFDSVRTQPAELSAKTSRKELQEILAGKELPSTLMDLASRFGVTLELKKRTNEITMTAPSQSALRIFRAVATDVIYGGSETAEKLFGLSANERFDTYLNFQNRHRRNRQARQMFGYPVQMGIKQLKEQYGLGTESRMEELRRKAYSVFSATQLRHRTQEIVGLFDKELTRRYDEYINSRTERKDELNKLYTNRDKGSYQTWEDAKEAYSKELGDIQNEIDSFTRMKAFEQATPQVIFDSIRDRLAAPLEISDDKAFGEAVASLFGGKSAALIAKNAAKYRQVLSDMVDNFHVLAENACKDLEVSELISIDISLNEIDDVSNKTTTDESESADDDGEVNSVTNQFKETWQYEFDTVSNWSKLSAKIRHMLYRCPRGGVTTLGMSLYYPPMQLFTEILQELNKGRNGIKMRNSKDMDAILDAIANEGKDWAKYVQGQLANDSQLKSQFYMVMRRYAQTLAIMEQDARYKDSDIKYKLNIINQGGTKNSIYVGVQNRLDSGVPLVDRSLSLFNGNDVLVDNIQKIRDILNVVAEEDRRRIPYMEPAELRKFLNENYPNAVKNLAKALNAVGFAISEGQLKNVCFKEPAGKRTREKNNYTFIAGGVYAVLKQIEEGTGSTKHHEPYKTVEELIKNIYKTSYKSLSESLALYDTGILEPSTRENGKSLYTYVLPSVLDDFMDQMGKSGDKDYLIDKYGDDPYYFTKELDSEGNIVYKARNPILRLVMEGNGYAFSYCRVVNAEVNKGLKSEYENLTNSDRMEIAWSMYNGQQDSSYANAQGIWYPISLPSDAGRLAYIRFGNWNSEEILEAIKEGIIKELERMTSTADDSHLPETYRKNKSKFCMFPVLNESDKITEYSKEKILSEFIEYTKTGNKDSFDKTLTSLAQAVIKSNRDKFRQEYKEFVESREKSYQGDEHDEQRMNEFIDNQSVFQMAINELLNGDPAFYTGYNTGSDNLQKRAKQNIVPLQHIDELNPDFLEAYRRYHHMDPDTELEPEEVTEHCLYLKDNIIESTAIDEIRQLYDAALNKRIIDRETYDELIKSMSGIKHTDGQAFRSFESSRMLMYATGEMKKGDDLDQAMTRIANGTQQPGDAEIVQTARKPFKSGLVKIKNPDGTTRLMPVQHKLSEQVLVAALVQARGTLLAESPALNALEKLMNEEGIDTVMFTSAVKVGQNGAVDFGDVDPETADEKSIYDKMRQQMQAYQEKTTLSIIHEIPYSLYGFVSTVNDDGLDAEINIATQMQKFIASDLPDMIYTYDENGEIEDWKKAEYYVEGYGKMSRDEIRSLYNRLFTEKIRREYERMTGEFADNESLSKALQRSLKQSSRKSSYLERAFSLDDNGNFIIPLCDMSTINMTSEFLNSLVKNAVVKIKAPGKQLVSMSSFGITKKLKIEFEYDDDGKPIAYKSMDCLLPAWSEALVKKCMNADGTLDFDKLASMDERMRKIIGVRVPTQAKSFILPLRCVGFLPTILGDSIITAADTVVLQDADFDVDKIPVLFPSAVVREFPQDWVLKAKQDFSAYQEQYYDYEKLRKDFKELKAQQEADGTVDENYKFVNFLEEKLDSSEEENYRKSDAPEGKPLSWDDWRKQHKEDYRLAEPEIEYADYNNNLPLSKQSEEALNNALISVMWGMLTSEAVVTQTLASGSPDRLDKIIDEINRLSTEEKIPDSPSDIASRMQQEERNAQGKQMIAVFAVSLAAHALAQHTKLALNSMHGFKINGRTLTSLHDVMTRENQYLSNLIGTSLGAAADNAKTPRLAYLNINKNTAPVVTLMMRLGYSLREIGYFMNIPSIRYYGEHGGEDYGPYNYLKEDAIHELPGGLKEMKAAIQAGGNTELLSKEMKEYNDIALSVFLEMKQIGEKLHQLDMLSRGDSGSSAPHGSIENNLTKMLQYDLFIESEKEDGFFENYDELFRTQYDTDISDSAVDESANPIAQAYITYGIMGAYHELAKFYPGLENEHFRETLKSIIKKYHKGKANVRVVKDIMYSMYNYMMSKYDCMKHDGDNMQNSRNYYLNIFPSEANEILTKYPKYQNSMFFNRLKLESALDTKDPFISFNYDGTLTQTQRDEIISVWQRLFYAVDDNGKPIQELRQLALDLFRYCYYRNGFRFGQDTFAHFAPVEARTEWPGFIDMLEELSTDDNTFAGFEIQYIRNMMHDRRYCPIKSSRSSFPIGIKNQDGSLKESFEMPIQEDITLQDPSTYDIYYINGEPRAAFCIPYSFNGGKIEYYYYVRTNFDGQKATYVRTTPLGWADRAVEFAADMDSVYMPSVFNQEQVARETRPRRAKGRGRQSVPVETETRSSGSEETNDNIDTEEMTLEEFFGLVPLRKKAKTSETKGKTKQTAKSKEQIQDEKDGGKKTKTKFKIIQDKTALGQISSVEAKCAQEYGVYTVVLTDPSSYRMAQKLKGEASNKNRFAALSYDEKSAWTVANALADTLRGRKSKHVVLNLTGSYMNTLQEFTDQKKCDSFIKKVYQAIKDKGIFIDKVITTAQPGVPLASARAAMSLGYVVEVHPTRDYKVYGSTGTAPEADKEQFMANLGSKHESEEHKKAGRVYDAEDGPFIVAKNNWTREIAEKDTKTLYVFTDNTDRTSGNKRINPGTAYAKKHGTSQVMNYPTTTSAVIRGLDNAYPISTQKTYSPGNPEAGRWQDSDYREFRNVIQNEIDDIIEEFESGEYRRVVLPVGGVAGGSIAGITKERTPRLFRILNSELERLENEIRAISETQVSEKESAKENEKEDSGVITDDSLLTVDKENKLSADDIEYPKQGMGGNLFVLDVDDMRGASVYNSKGSKITGTHIYVVTPKGMANGSAEAWEKAKVYSKEGYLITDTLKFSIDGKQKYGLLTSRVESTSAVVRNALYVPTFQYSKDRPLNKGKYGLKWLDDNNEPLC